MTLLSLDNIPAMQDEVRALAAERGAVILAHNYQLPEIQQVADYVGDSLGLSQQAAALGRRVIAFCGVHFMAETASILCPEKTVLLPDPDAGCSLADSITAEQLRAWKAEHPGAVVVMYVNTTAEVKAETDYCVTSSNAVARGRAHLPRARRGHRDPLRPRHVPRRLRREDDRPADARVGRRVPRPRRHPPARHHDDARRAPGRRLPHPPRVRLLDLGAWSTSRRATSTRGRPHALDRRDARVRAERHGRAATAIVATEIGMLHALQRPRRTWTSSPPTRRRAAAT